MSAAVISVIIPTRNRRASLERLLLALRNDGAAPPFEIIIVDDGSSDDTVAWLRQAWNRRDVLVIAQHGAGPAAARNAGAAAARGRILLFLDDDTEPLPGTLAAHLRVHDETDGCVGIGDLPPVVEGRGFFDITLRGWWEMMLASIQRPGHRFEYKNLLTGNVSVTRTAFEALGGFDPELRCHEDWEFGYRALTAGLTMRFVAGAVARHHETSDLRKALQRKCEEGIADIQLTVRHPDLARTLPFAWWLPSRKARLIKRLTFVAPRLAAVLVWHMHKLLPLYESVKLRFRWRETLELLLVYHYWRGVRSIMPDRHAVAALATQVGGPDVPMVVDLARGIEEAAAEVERRRPGSVRLVFGEEEVGVVRPWPGAEPLRARHVRHLLAYGFRHQLLAAMARHGVIPPAVASAVASGAGRDAARPRTPLMPDEQLPAQLGPAGDVQHRPAVPPVHHVA